jgi:hypothetical protein
VTTWEETNNCPAIISDYKIHTTREEIVKICLQKKTKVITSNPKIGVYTKEIIGLDNNMKKFTKD